MSARRRIFWRSGVAAIGLSCAFAAFAQDSVDLTLSEARAVARNALQTGEAALARDLAMGLLQADPEDAYAYAVLASAHSQLGNPKLARSAARLTYKHSRSDANKFTAARAAGQLAFDQDRMTTAQVWLRRAAIHANSDAQEKVLKRDYSAVRAQNPWRFSIKGSVTPSSNINNGAESEQVYVNGVLQNVTLGASSKALSGLVGTLDTQVSYRLRHTKASRTTAGASFVRQAHAPMPLPYPIAISA